MEVIRGIQKCQSESKAIILGILIPLGIGAAILGIVWLIRRRNRMRSMRAGMLVPNAENNEPPNDNPENAPNPDPNSDNLNPDNANLANSNPRISPPPPIPGSNIPYSSIPPHIPANDIPIDDDAPGGILLSSPHVNNNAPSFVVDPQLHNANPISPPSDAAREAAAHLAHPRSSLRSSTYSSSPRLPSLRNSTTSVPSPPAQAEPDLRSSSASGGSLHQSGNMYFNPFYMEGEEEEEPNGKAIPMQPLAQSVGQNAELPRRGDADTSEDEEEEMDEEDDDEEEEEDEDEESEGSGEESGRERDPGDLFAGMMGIPLPRAPGRS